MTIPEQAGKAIEALKGSPGLLALILLQFITLGLLYFSDERRHAREMAVIERCLLATGTGPPLTRAP